MKTPPPPTHNPSLAPMYSCPASLFYRRPLYSASWHGCLEAVNFLLQSEEGIQSLNKATVKGATPAYAAALQGHIEILKQLHSEGADLVAADKNGVSPLHAVVWHRRTQCLEYLLAQDDVLSAINACGSSGITALWVAVQRGDEEAIALLVGSGATFGGCPPSQVSREFVLPDHPPAVASSAQRGGREGLQRRASFGEQEGKVADEEEPPPQPVDPEELARAAAEGDMDVLLRFTALGENMDRRDEFGKTPLRLVGACRRHRWPCASPVTPRLRAPWRPGVREQPAQVRAVPREPRSEQGGPRHRRGCNPS